MNLLLDLVSRRAFTPDPLNETCPLAERFARRPLIAISLNRDSLDAVSVTYKSGEPVLNDIRHFDFDEEDSEAVFIGKYAGQHGARECVVSLNYGFKVAVTRRARRPSSGSVEVEWMRRDAEHLIGEPIEAGQRGALAFHPTHDFALMFTILETELTKAAALIGRSNLGVARMHIGVCSLVREIVASRWDLVGKQAQLLVVTPNVVFHATLQDKRLDDPGYAVLRPGEVLEEVGDRLGRLIPSSRVILVNSSPFDIAKLIRDQNRDNEIVEPFFDQPLAILRACCLS